MFAVLMGNAAFHPKCGKKSGPTSEMSRDVDPVEGKCNLGYKEKKKQGFLEPADLARRPRGSKLSEIMTGKPKGKSFLAKAGFEKRDPVKELGFFVDREKGTSAGIYKILPTISLIFRSSEILGRRERTQIKIQKLGAALRTYFFFQGRLMPTGIDVTESSNRVYSAKKIVGMECWCSQG